MRVRVEFQLGERVIREEVEGSDATAILAFAKQSVMRQLGWKGIFLAPFTPLTFAQDVVRRYNDHFNTNYAQPQTAEQFIQFGEETGSLTILEH
jgi:hypothetical protein